MNRYPAPSRRPVLRCAASLSALCAAVVLSGCAGSRPVTPAPTPLTVNYTGATTGQITLAYSGAIVATNGTPPYTCALSSGTLPSGLSLSSSACTVTGTPTGTLGGSYPLTFTVTDSSTTTRTGSASVTLVIAVAPLVITSTTLPGGAAGVQYLATIATTGGAAPISCSLLSGALDGLTLNSNCTLSGVPSGSGTFPFAAMASDSSVTPETATGNLTFTIAATPNTRVAVGTLPLIGASVQIYAAGVTGNGSAPTALLSAPLVTNAFGSFTLPASSTYTCPTASSVVYVVARGGYAGNSGATDPGAVLMASPGVCANLATTANLVLNEVTTAASAYAFAQFLAPGAQLGATATNLLGITSAAATANNLVPSTSGVAAAVGTVAQLTGTALTGLTEQSKLNLVANILNACLAAGPSGTACTTLYAATTVNGVVPANTLDAARILALYPAIAVAPLYALVPATPAYNPTPTTAPADWTLAVIYNGGGLTSPSAVAIDSQGRVWVANHAFSVSLFTNLGIPVFPGGIGGNGFVHSYGGAVDANDNFIVSNMEYSGSSGSISAVSKTGSGLAGFPTAGGGIYYPVGIALDTNGLIWVTDYGDSAVSILKSDGSSYAGASGYQNGQLIFPIAVAVDSSHNAWVADQSSTYVTRISLDGTSFTSYSVGGAPSGVAIDASNNVWTANYGTSSIGLVTGAGVVKSTYPGFTGGGVTKPNGIAVDGAGNVWVTNYHGTSISELASATSATPGAPLSPDPIGFGSDADIVEGYALAVDFSGNIWVSSQASNSLTQFVGIATPVKTPLIGVVAKP